MPPETAGLCLTWCVRFPEDRGSYVRDTTAISPNPPVPPRQLSQKTKAAHQQHLNFYCLMCFSPGVLLTHQSLPRPLTKRTFKLCVVCPGAIIFWQGPTQIHWMIRDSTLTTTLIQLQGRDSEVDCILLPTPPSIYRVDWRRTLSTPWDRSADSLTRPTTYRGMPDAGIGDEPFRGPMYGMCDHSLSEHAETLTWWERLGSLDSEEARKLIRTEVGLAALINFTHPQRG